MGFLAVGLSHHEAPLAVRERAYLEPEEIRRALPALVGHADLLGALCLSTCNRTDFYVTTRSTDQMREAVVHFLRYLAPDGVATPYVRCFEGPNAIRHVFRVASGLDSMVLGESQILAQLKAALRLAHEAGTVDHELDLVMRGALATAKKVRTETGIGREAVGIAQAAVAHAARVLGPLAGRTVAVVGAGTVGAAAARLLRDAGVDRFWVAARGQRSAALAATLSARVFGLQDLTGLGPELDLVVCATASQRPVLDHEAVAALQQQRDRRPLLVLDLAVPRDVDPTAGSVAGVELVDLDALGLVIQRNRESRAGHRPAADRIVAAAVVETVADLERRAAAPVISALVDRAEAVRRSELERTLTRLRPLTAEERRQLDRLTQAIASKLLHAPIAYLRLHAADSGRTAWLQEVFGIDPVRPR